MFKRGAVRALFQHVHSQTEVWYTGVDMTREQIQRYFPDTYDFFSAVADTHPFWAAVSLVDLSQGKSGRTLLSDMEQVFSSLHEIDGHHVLRDHLEDLDTNDQLMEMLTRLYVAYLYRAHKTKLVHNEEHGYDIEIEIADQLMALGVVHFQNFDSITDQFKDEIQADLSTMEGEASEVTTGKTLSFMKKLRDRAGQLKEHPTAHHQIMAAVTDHAFFGKEYDIARHIARSRSTLEKELPHISGILLIDPTPGRERAKYIGFHGDDHHIERLVNKIG